MVEVAFIYQCACCGKTEGKRFKIPTGGQVPNLSTPEKWSLLDNKYICDRHEVKVTDKQ